MKLHKWIIEKATRLLNRLFNGEPSSQKQMIEWICQNMKDHPRDWTHYGSYNLVHKDGCSLGLGNYGGGSPTKIEKPVRCPIGIMGFFRLGKAMREWRRQTVMGSLKEGEKPDEQ